MVKPELLLVTLLMLQGKLNQAADQLHFVLRQIEERPHDHPQSLANAYMLGGDLASQRASTAEAEDYYRKALDVARQYLDHRPVIRAAILSKLGYMLQDSPKKDEGLRMVIEAQHLREEFLPAGHPDIAQSAVSLAAWYLRDEEYDQALGYVERGLAAYRHAYGNRPHLFVAHTLVWKARVLSQLGRKNAALDALNEAVETYVTVLGPDDFLVANARSIRGEVFTHLQQWDQALADLEFVRTSFNSLGDAVDSQRKKANDRRLDQLHQARPQSQSRE